MKKKFYTYGYLSPAPDNILYYIGKGKNNRAYDKQHTIAVPEDKGLIIFFSDDLTTYHKEPQYFTEEKAFELEKTGITKYGRKDLEEGYLLNKTNGGEGTSGISKEHRRRISDAKKGEKNPNFGKPHSKEHRRRISESTKGRTSSKKSRILISKAKKGILNTEEHNRNISEAKVAWYKTQTKVKCNHCGALHYKQHISQWHNDKCKHRATRVSL